MTKLTRMTLFSLALITIGVVQTSIHAAVEFNPAGFSLNNLNGSDTVLFPYFDTQGGTRVLQSVSVSYYEVQATYSGGITNDSAQPNEILVEMVGDVDATGLPAFSSFDVSYSASDTKTIGGNGFDTYTLVDIVNNFASPNPADYIGTGSFSVTLNGTGVVSKTSLEVPTAPFTVDYEDGSVAGTLNVDYTYTVIPEPASLILLSVGSLVLLKRKRTN